VGIRSRSRTCPPTSPSPGDSAGGAPANPAPLRIRPHRGTGRPSGKNRRSGRGRAGRPATRLPTRPCHLPGAAGTPAADRDVHGCYRRDLGVGLTSVSRRAGGRGASWLPPGRLVAAAAGERLREAAAPPGEYPAGVQVDHPTSRSAARGRDPHPPGRSAPGRFTPVNPTPCRRLVIGGGRCGAGLMSHRQTDPRWRSARSRPSTSPAIRLVRRAWPEPLPQRDSGAARHQVGGLHSMRQL
jgi:hypothetical protein